MRVEIPISLGVMTEMGPMEALQMLCQVLGMEFVLDNETNYYVRKDVNGAFRVLTKANDKEIIVDDRGSLFLALRQLAACMEAED